MTDAPDEVQRWTAKRKPVVVMSIVKGETSADEAACRHGLTVAEIERWKEQFFAAGENALRARPRDEDAAKEARLETLQRKVRKRKVRGLVLNIDVLKEANKGRPFGPGTCDESGRPYSAPLSGALAATSACRDLACARRPPRRAGDAPSAAF